MCGIVGYIGRMRSDEILLKNLKKLEYRGYDSSGIAVLKNNEIIVRKESGCIANLEKTVEEIYGSCGIAHTRWATHGKPTKENAHPHTSSDNEWAIVHNGIIENYGELKEDLIRKNISFSSETDSEVVAQLLSVGKNENLMERVIDVCGKLVGSYALICVNKNTPNTLYLAKQKSPLYVGIKSGEVFVGSDPICLSGMVDNYYSLEDGEFCQASSEKLVFFDSYKNIINKASVKPENINYSSGLGDYPHYMLKEIEEVPSVLRRVVDVYKQSNILDKIDISNVNKIIIVGCGTAYHAGLMGSKYIERLVRIDCSCHVASEFRYSDPIIDDKTLAIFVSQSGETADTISALDLAKSKGAKIVALTNVLYSTVAKKSDIILPVCAGPEIAVASTKAYSAQITVFYMLAKCLQNKVFSKNVDYFGEVEKLSDALKQIDFEDVRELSKVLVDKKEAFFIGRNRDYVTSEEASLKLKEITYINSSAYPAGELKHGFLALIENDTYVFMIATEKDLLEKTLNGAFESMARGGKIFAFSQFDLKKYESENFRYIKMPNLNEEVMPILSISYFQMLSYLTSIAKGLNPDKPRNLAKSVTVE